MTDKQIYRRLAAAVARGELTRDDAQLAGERSGIDFAEFEPLPDVCSVCGATESQWWRESKGQLFCGKCARVAA